jgi:hypothetical protein
LRGDIVMSAYSYIEDDGVVLLPLDQRWPLEPMLTAAQFAHMVALMLRDVVFDPVSVVLGLDGRFFHGRRPPQNGGQRRSRLYAYTGAGNHQSGWREASK